MSDSLPGIRAIFETEEVEFLGQGPDNNHRKFHRKGQIKSTSTDTGNTSNTTTLRGGMILAKKTSDGLLYPYDGDATDGTQIPVGILEKHLSMLSRDGVAENKFKGILGGGLLQNPSADLVGYDYQAMAVLLRSGFIDMTGPHGSSFLLQPLGRSFHTADYTVLASDHGKMLVAITNAVNFTLPTLSGLSPGWEVLIYNAVDASAVITGAANTIIYGDAGGALSTTLTFSTTNKKMGGHALMRADYGTDGTTMQWYVLCGGTVPVSA